MVLIPMQTPSDCAVPEKFSFRFDRRLTPGETVSQALSDIESLASVHAARESGLKVIALFVQFSCCCTGKGCAD